MLASPPSPVKPSGPEVTVVKLAQEVNPDGSYNYEYELSNGVNAQESGIGGQSATGSFKYTAPDGTPIEIKYTADANGFQPQGDSLPTPPPTPDAILRSLEYIKAHPSPEANTAQ